jgi:integrase
MKITKSRVDALKPGQIIADDNLVGFCARRLPSGAVTYGYRYRAGGRQHWVGLGVHGDVTSDEARKRALRTAASVRDGNAPVSAAANRKASADNTLQSVCENYFAREGKNLRTVFERQKTLRRLVYPRLGGRPIDDVRRSDIVRLLDKIEDDNGAPMADHALAYLRRVFNWAASRSDDFRSPIVRGMRRAKPKPRTRILSDQEIRDLWTALDTAVTAPFAALIRALLLTCQRRDEVARMAWEEIDGDLWEIPAERYKTQQPNGVPLTRAVRELIGAPKEGYVFSTDGGTRPISGFSKAKRAIDAAIAALRKAEAREPMPPWRLHDLRRTGRSLMSRAGVPADHGERVLGHVINGVRGTYDRHLYEREKRDALERLSALVHRILDPSSARVVPLTKAR